MERRILICCVLVLIYLVDDLNSADSTTKPPVSKKPSSDKNSTSNAVTVASVEPVTTTTRRPFLQGFRLPCSCFKGQCGCCTGVILERFKQKACMNVTYEPDEFAFTAALSLNNRVLYKNSISGKNPPPICIRLPRFSFIQLCVEFSNIYFANRNMHVCIDMEANWESLTLLDISFDCIRMGVNGVAIVGPEAGGGLPIAPIDEEEQTDEDYDDSARNVDFSFIRTGTADENNISPENHTNLTTTLSLTNTDKTKSNYLKYANSKNNPKRGNSTYNMKNASATNANRIPISVKRLVSGDFLITLDENTTIEEKKP
ncbi:hypothetical protein ILUMI_06726 [Ignelater luminosus]|uniref:DUF4773 domain-containing protein n=1 Tax=Ignelater luminosus TaxID=2038154 RepID=A0A8K0DAK4_IGNLU|nr:hypothetical protein ILUMI_06726 [Ignelater luminosus]